MPPWLFLFLPFSKEKKRNYASLNLPPPSSPSYPALPRSKEHSPHRTAGFGLSLLVVSVSFVFFLLNAENKQKPNGTDSYHPRLLRVPCWQGEGKLAYTVQHLTLCFCKMSMYVGQKNTPMVGKERILAVQA